MIIYLERRGTATVRALLFVNKRDELGQKLAMIDQTLRRSTDRSLDEPLNSQPASQPTK